MARQPGGIDMSVLARHVVDQLKPGDDKFVVLAMAAQAGVRKFNMLCEWELFPGGQASEFVMYARQFNGYLHTILLLPKLRLLDCHALAFRLGTVSLDEVYKDVFVLALNLPEGQAGDPATLWRLKEEEDHFCNDYLTSRRAGGEG